jgi:hypothetical protein
VAAREAQEGRGHAHLLRSLHQIAQHVLALGGATTLNVAQHRRGEQRAVLRQEAGGDLDD